MGGGGDGRFLTEELGKVMAVFDSSLDKSRGGGSQLHLPSPRGKVQLSSDGGVSFSRFWWYWPSFICGGGVYGGAKLSIGGTGALPWTARQGSLGR